MRRRRLDRRRLLARFLTRTGQPRGTPGHATFLEWCGGKDIDFALLRRMTGQWRDVADYYLGDYYPLTPYSRSEEVWMAWQFDRPDLGGGVIQAFRRAASPMSAATFPLSGLDPAASYDVIDLDTGPSRTLTGAQLMDEGLPIAIENRSAAKVVRYSFLP